MPKIKVQKSKNYTVISNNIFKNTQLSLKAKGLLSQMLSLPDDWDYTVAGLAKLSRDGRDSISSALKELENHGYLTRNRIRNAQGCIIDIEYVIYEFPLNKENNPPEPENPKMDSIQAFHPKTEYPEMDSIQVLYPQSEYPQTENLELDSPTSDFSPQLNTKLINKKGNIISNQSIPEIDNLIDSIKNQINYNDIITFDNSLKVKCDELISIIAETLLSNKKTYRINNTNVSEVLVKKRFQQITSADIYYVINCMDNTTSNISNIHQYLFTTLYNAPTTRAFYYAQKAQQNLTEGRGVTC